MYGENVFHSLTTVREKVAVAELKCSAVAVSGLSVGISLESLRMETIPLSLVNHR